MPHFEQYYSCQKDELEIILDKSNSFLFHKKAIANKNDIWLYYDCAGVLSDNGYLQFEHDMLKDDGIRRYYIVTDRRQIKNKFDKRNYVVFGSKKHKSLIKKCSKIITAYIEDANIIPYAKEDYEKYSLTFNFEVIYLQHGVLHIIMPWKYAREKIN